jgi:diadenosine tetraphosphate (Ap4A) HIT family hydrolase
MPLILETTKFIVSGHDQPHHDRDNGGHAKVTPKQRYGDRTEMPMGEYLALMQLVMLTGEAITTVLRQRGVPVVRINYQDNGNWGYFPGRQTEPHLHIQLYVRSQHEQHPESDPRFRAFPDALVFPFIDEYPEYYRSFKPYSEEDCAAIRAEMERLLGTEKYAGVREKL